MKAYISGPMTGLKDYNRPTFNQAAKSLRESGYEVLNPAEVDIPNGEWLDYMRVDIRMLTEADVIFMLPGWMQSPGAKIEHDLAYQLGIDIENYELWLLKEAANA